MTSPAFLSAVQFAGDLMLALMAVWLLTALIVVRKISPSAVAFGVALGIAMHTAPAWAADTQIDGLASQDPVQTGDQIPINRPANTDGQVTAGTFRYLKDTMVNVTSVTDSPGTSQNDYSPTGWDGTEPSKATIIRVTPTETVKITGLAGGNGNDGREAKICNALDGTGASGELLWLEHENASSTAANRFLFADRLPRFLLPGDCIDLWYDDTSDRWRPVDLAIMQSNIPVFDEFGGSAPTAAANPQSGFFTGLVSGTASTCQASVFLANGTENPQGTTVCDMGTTTTGRGGFGYGASGTSAQAIVPVEGQAFFIARLTVETLSNATDEYNTYAGFQDCVGVTDCTDGVYWMYDRNTSVNWQFCIEDATTQTCTATSQAVSTTDLHWLVIYITGDWSEADFLFSADGLSWSREGGQSGANIPDAADLVSIGATCQKSAGTTSVNGLQLDAMGYRYDTNGRGS